MLELVVTDSTEVAQARREVATAVSAAGLDDVATGQLALVVTELGTNLVKHGGGGQLLIRINEGSVDVLALDSGPGMADVARCLADGYSTTGTLGHGLGAVQRLSQQLEIVSWPGRGTVVFARLGRAGASDAESQVGALVLPKPGELVAGDAWSRRDDAQGRSVLMVDGLGHGTHAAEAANAAVKQFQRSSSLAPQVMVEELHQALRPTRGAAVAVARLDVSSQNISFAGLGNIAAVAMAGDGQLRRLVSHNGTAGHNARKVQAFDYPCADGLLIMHSDGLRTHWALDTYPGLARAHPLLVAGVLMRDQRRGSDDAGVLVARMPRP